MGIPLLTRVFMVRVLGPLSCLCDRYIPNENSDDHKEVPQYS